MLRDLLTVAFSSAFCRSCGPLSSPHLLPFTASSIFPTSTATDLLHAVIEREQAEVAATVAAGSLILISFSPSKRWWPSGEKGSMNDAGWGRKLRTRVSLLAMAPIRLHLERGT